MPKTRSWATAFSTDLQVNMPLARPRRGRRPASESKAALIRATLWTWRQTPREQRVSLRALAVELGTSHQLLSFYLRDLDRWQMREHRRAEKQILACAKAEHRELTPREEAQAFACGRPGLAFMLSDMMSKDPLGSLRKLRKLAH